MRRLIRAVAAIMAAAWLSAGCSAPEERTNFQHCLADDYRCNSALLGPEETQKLIEVRAPQHFLECLQGLRCNDAILSEPQLRQVRQARAQRNFEACLKGDADCRRDLLDDAQRAQVEQAGESRNFMYCVSGLSACDEAALTAEQQAAAREAYLQRNFSGCMNSVGTLLRCNSDDLSAEQRDLVHERNVAVNFWICSHALLGCDDALLTPDQRAAMQEKNTPSPRPSPAGGEGDLKKPR
jgi:hypothetical protein